MKCFVYRYGVIGFSDLLDGDALEVADAPKMLLKGIVGVVARHGYTKGVLLCPGVPEAEDDDAALDAVAEFRWMIDDRLAKAASDPEYMSIYVDNPLTLTPAVEFEAAGQTRLKGI